MRRDRIVPLIIAVALFMENMDSTVIATSLPAIATDIGTNPLALKLAVTSYLLSLAIFIPASGWTADRFGARTVFRAAIAVFMLGSIGCALSSSLTDFVIARIVQGMGGAMMTPVGRMVLVRSISRRFRRQAKGKLICCPMIDQSRPSKTDDVRLMRNSSRPATRRARPSFLASRANAAAGSSKPRSPTTSA